MKNLILATVILLIAAMNTQAAPVSGTHIINGPGHLQQAMSAIANQGLSGTVYLKLRAGNYGSLTIDNIWQTTPTRRIVIMSKDYNAQSVIFSKIHVNGTDYVTFYAVTVQKTSIYSDGALRVSGSDHFAMLYSTIITRDRGIQVVGDDVHDHTYLNIDLFKTGGISGYGFKSTASSLTHIQMRDCSISGKFYEGLNASFIQSSDFFFNKINLTNSGCNAQVVKITAMEGGIRFIGNEFIGRQGSSCGGSMVYIQQFGSNLPQPTLQFISNSFSSSNSNLELPFVTDAELINNSLRSHSGQGVHATSRPIYNLTMINNAFYTEGYCYSNSNSFTGNHNLYYRENGSPQIIARNNHSTTLASRQASGQDQNSLYGNPGFVNQSNLHLANNNSPAIGNGTYISTAILDIDKGNRGSRFDIGADEYGVSKSAATETPAFVLPSELTLSTYPNPNNGQFRVKGDFSRNATYRLLDTQGRSVAHGVLGKGAVDVTNVNSGRYVMQVIDADRVGNVSIMVQ